MNVCIVVRATADYHNMTDEEFEDQLNGFFPARTELQEMLKNSIPQKWGSIFNVGFREFRARAKDIAEVCLSNTDCRVVRGREEFRDWYQWEEDEIIVPVDDDDWISPMISELNMETPVVAWVNSVFLNTHKAKFYFNNNGVLASNNWAVKKSYLKSLDPKQAEAIVLMSHAHADSFLRESLGEWPCLRKHYNLYNQHIGGLSHLRDSSEEKLKDYSDLPMIGVPPKIEWAREYVLRMTNLNHDCRA